MLKLIKTDQDYQEAMAAVSALMDVPEAEMTDEQGDELEVRALLIERYEDGAFPIIATDAVNAIELVMETKGLTRSDLEGEFGGKGAMSEVLNRHRALSKGMIQRLHERLRIPLDILFKPYPLRARGLETATVTRTNDDTALARAKFIDRWKRILRVKNQSRLRTRHSTGLIPNAPYRGNHDRAHRSGHARV